MAGGYELRGRVLEPGHGLFLGHGKVLVIHTGGLVAPGGIDVAGDAVQCGHRPDVVSGGRRGAGDALQLQQQVIGGGVAVADGQAVAGQPIQISLERYEETYDEEGQLEERILERREQKHAPGAYFNSFFHARKNSGL